MLLVVVPLLLKMLHLKQLTINIVADVAGFLIKSSSHTWNFGPVPLLVAPTRRAGLSRNSEATAEARRRRKRNEGGPKSESVRVSQAFENFEP
jgi:hypothetical protein